VATGAAALPRCSARRTLNLLDAEIAAFQTLKSGGATGPAQVEPQYGKCCSPGIRPIERRGWRAFPPYGPRQGQASDRRPALRSATEADQRRKKKSPAFYDVLLNYPQS